MSKIYIKHYKFALGDVIIGIYENQLCLLDWQYRKQREAIDYRISNDLNATYTVEDHQLHHKVIVQIQEYFNNKRNEFDIPLLLTGTTFQKAVWNELLKIPYGQTISYISLSRKLYKEKAIRAVASANGANALLIVIPCHRVIGSNGDLIGYAGGLLAKKKLLQIEGALQSNQLGLF